MKLQWRSASAAVAATLLVALCVYFEAERTRGSAELLSPSPSPSGASSARLSKLAVSASVKKQLDQSRVPSSAQVRKPIDAVASLLAREQLYKAVAKHEATQRGREGDKKKGGPGFVAWTATLSSPAAQTDVEAQVKKRLLDNTSGYGSQIRQNLPPSFRRLLPALATQAAHEATSEAFRKLRSQMILAGQWDVGYLPRGNSLLNMPEKFAGKYIGDREGLGKACKKACEGRQACRGYTYNPSKGVCYLKTVDTPEGGFSCTGPDCWYWGQVLSHPHVQSLSIQDAQRDLGLYVTDLKVGTGEEIKKGDTVTMGYVGKLQDGSVFDQGKYVFEFGAGQVITGDDIGLKGMRVGGKRKLVVPPALAYGSQGYPGSIPPDATITFDVSLLGLSQEQLSGGYKASNDPD